MIRLKQPVGRSNICTVWNKQMSKLPNIVIFNPDSYRGDVLGHLGNAGAVTPNLDRLVREGGVSYANAFAQNPACTPSRCSFMTGWYPHVHGHRSMRYMLQDHEPNLFSVLRREDYHVWWGGKNDLFALKNKEDYLKHCDTKYHPEKPYKEYYPPPKISPQDPRHSVFYRGVMPKQGKGEKVSDRDYGNTLGAADFITSYSAENPFCVYLPLSWPHPSYRVEEDFYHMIDPDNLPPRRPVPENDFSMLDDLRGIYRSEEISEDDWKEIRRVYYGMCTKIDSLFGKVVAALKKKGEYDNTLIIFLSDHGDFTGDYSLPEKAGTFHDSLLRVPFIVKPPASVVAQPGIRTHLTELIDMPATIYDLLGIEPGYDHMGRSLVGSLCGDNSEIRQAVFAEHGSREKENAYKNSEVFNRPPHDFYGLKFEVVLKYQDVGTYGVSVRNHKYKYVRRPYFKWDELYDLESDPGELHNLIKNPEYSEVNKQMENLLLNYFMTTADVLPYQQDPRNV